MENYEKTVGDLRQAFKTGRTKDLAWRVKQLEGLLRMYDENVSAFAKALNQDINKPLAEVMVSEVDFLRNDVITALREIKEWMRGRPVRKATVALLDTLELRPEPYGVALIIGAWNYPFQLTLAPLTGAIAAGNCAIIKPSEISPHSAKVMEELLPKYLDTECFKVSFVKHFISTQL